MSLIKTITRVEVNAQLDPELAVKLNNHLKSTLNETSDNDLLAFANSLDNAVNPKPRTGNKPGPKPKNQAAAATETKAAEPKAAETKAPEVQAAATEPKENGKGKTRIQV